MNFTEYNDIYDFYQKTGMNRYQAYEFLKNELKERNEHGNERNR